MTGRLAGVLAEWGATEPIAVAETATSRIIRVRLTDGSSAIVKDLKPIGIEDELRGADYLAWRAGSGAVRLLARTETTLLLEDAGDRTLLGDLERLGDEAATRVLIDDVLVGLHSAGGHPWPSQLMPLEERLSSLFARAAADRLAGVASILPAAADLARRLLAEQEDVRPLHGDLHHDNVLRSPRGWLAIDPKGLVGDGAFDAANLFYNPIHRDALRTDVDRIRGIAATYATRFDRDRAIVLGWGFVDVCLSAAWHTEDGRPDKVANDLRIAAAIEKVMRWGDA